MYDRLEAELGQFATDSNYGGNQYVWRTFNRQKQPLAQPLTQPLSLPLTQPLTQPLSLPLSLTTTTFTLPTNATTTPTTTSNTSTTNASSVGVVYECSIYFQNPTDWDQGSLDLLGKYINQYKDNDRKNTRPIPIGGHPKIKFVGFHDPGASNFVTLYVYDTAVYKIPGENFSFETYTKNIKLDELIEVQEKSGTYTHKPFDQRLNVFSLVRFGVFSLDSGRRIGRVWTFYF